MGLKISLKKLSKSSTVLFLVLITVTSHALENEHSFNTSNSSIFSNSENSQSTARSDLNHYSTPLISRSIFFGNPQRARVLLSPDGKHFSYLAPHEGVLNVWVGDVNDPNSMHPITHNSKRGVSDYIWANTNQHIIYMDDNEGNEDWRIYRVDVNSGEKLSLVSKSKVQARLIAQSQYHPEEILVGINQRRPDFHDVYRLNIINGALDLILENNHYADFLTDHHLQLKLGLEMTPEGGGKYYLFNQKSGQLKDYERQELLSVEQVDMVTTSPLMFNKNADMLYMVDSRGRNTAALVAMHLKNKQLQVLAENSHADITNIMIHPTEKNAQAYSATYEKTEWTPIDRSIESDLQYLSSLSEGEMYVLSRSLDDKSWIVAYQNDTASPHYYFYNRPERKALFLFSARPELDNVALNKMDPVIITSRDNLKLVSYLTLPNEVRVEAAKASQPVPLILNVHGGPTARDNWGYDPEHQWLSNRGYAVLSVNYRGSTGFGKQFTNAGNGEWAAKMNDDLVDAVNWAIKQGITTKDKVAIMGGSYGGYATLIGLTKNPDLYACGVDIVGVSNLVTLMKSIPEYWKPFYAMLKIMIGADPETEEGQKFLASRSPLTYVDNIKKPLLIGQGANDPRVKQAESDQIVQAMQSKNIPVTYVLYPDEGHGFQRPENRISFYAITEIFLAKNLGGRFEPINNDFNNSSLEIKTGKDILN